MADGTRAAGAIYDLGYQRYDGARLGRANAIRTLVEYSVRTAFGIGRGEAARRVPALVVLIVFVPAIITVGIASATGQPGIINYARHLEFTAFLLALFVAAQAPELVVADRQQGVLALYLSRPLHASDYVLARLIALVLALLVLTLGPLTMLFVAKIFISATPWATFMDEWSMLFPIVGGTLGTSFLFASAALGIAAFARTRNLASAGVIGSFLLLGAASSMFYSLTDGDVRRYVVLTNPVWVMNGFVNWLFDIEAQRRSVVGRADLPGQYYLFVILGVGVLATLALLMRYRNRDT